MSVLAGVARASDAGADPRSWTRSTASLARGEARWVLATGKNGIRLRRLLFLPVPPVLPCRNGHAPAGRMSHLSGLRKEAGRMPARRPGCGGFILTADRGS